MCIGKNTESDTFKFDNVWLDNSKEELIFEITIDSKLTLDSHIKIPAKELVKKWMHFLEHCTPWNK